MTGQVASPSSPTSPRSPELPLAELERLHLSSRPNGQGGGANGGGVAGGLQITDEELEQFRARWREEVKSRKGEHGTRSSVRMDGGTGADLRGGVNLGPVRWKEKEKDKEIGVESVSSPNMVETKLPTKSPKNQKQRPLLPPDLDEVNESGPSKSNVSTSGTTMVNVPGPTSTSPTSSKSRQPRISHAGAEKERAVQLYAKAVEHEQSGKLNDALMLYRKAFRMDDDVDRLYARSVAKAAQTRPVDGTGPVNGINETSPSAPTPSSTDIVSPSAPVDVPYSFQRHLQFQPDYVKAAPPLAPTTSIDDQLTTINTLASPSVLTTLLDSLHVPAHSLTFLPADEDLPTPISKLPSELLDPILTHLDVTSIERFASTCWRARYLTHVSNVWRKLALGIYKTPAMVPDGLGVRDLVRRHRGEWRTTFLEEERVRMDGCYIAVCHYIRPGAGDQWVTITHMITYHRFLRFYPDGSVISFLTTEHPSEIVPSLRPTLRGKGLHFGRWRLIRSDAPPSPDDPPYVPTKPNEKRPPARILITDLLEPGVEGPKYEFEMELALRETSRGRWNKLDIIDYRSINLVTGESLALALKHQKPFYFSKVRSYNPPL
ncbi:hypothetical protein IAR55_001901 [Kwoniella newhampshirensis]|uniref:F-box domain-containing protein n=1 Tax=Kwoniella newhampshirensis TaxID=1651941 RepID=A0AAW0Z3F8_9TREE